MIRTICILLFISVVFLISPLLWAVLWIYGKVNKTKADMMCLSIAQWAFNVVIKLAGTKITVIGEENIPAGPVLYVGNHRSYFDIIVTYVQTKGLLGFVAKVELEKIPILRVWMRKLYCLFLDRDNVRESLKTILTAIDYVKAGVSVFIFPEGTRSTSEDYTLLPFHAGSFKIAEKGGCPIIPVSITNTYEVLEKQFPRIKPCHVIIEYGKPIDPKSLSREEKKTLASDVQMLIQETVRKNRELL